MSQPNIDYMMNMTKEYLDGKIDSITYHLDFPYELEKLHKKMHREDDDYCDLIYECLYEEGLVMYNELSEAEFKKLIRKQYNYIKKRTRRILLGISPTSEADFLGYGRCSTAYH